MPKSAVASVTTEQAHREDLRTTRSAVERRTALSARGSRRPSACDSSSGRFHSSPSRTNETTRTIAAVVKKNDSGTGRSRTPPIP